MRINKNFGGVYCESERLYIRAIQLSDTPLIVKWKDDPYTRKMSVGVDTEITVDNQERDIARSIVSDNEVYLIIVLKATNKPIGYIRLNWLDDNRRLGWLRFGLGEERGHGYAREALKATITKFFKNGLHRIDAEVFDFNHRSHGLLQDLGFKHEGTRRLAHYTNEGFYNIYILGLLDSEWA
jgi:RimJ/RimL family protein N-acetyltransferase